MSLTQTILTNKKTTEEAELNPSLTVSIKKAFI